MPARRPSPAALLVALVLALLAPVGVVMATGLAHGGAGEDGEVETADGRDPDGRVTDPDAPITVGVGPSMTGTAPSATVPPSTEPATTVPPAPATTAQPTTTAAPPPPTTAAPPPPTTAPPPPPPAGAADQVVALANEARAQAGCGPLRVDARITAAAQAHSDDMAANGYFSHDSLDGRSFADRLRAAGYPSPGGENIAQGQRNAQSVHQAWMNSSGHRANILNCGFTTIGVGVNQTAWTWTQDFGY